MLLGHTMALRWGVWWRSPRLAKESKMYAIPLACLLALLANAALAQRGMTVPLDGSAGPRSAERSLRLGTSDINLDLSVAQPGSSPLRARLLGDYYLTGPGFGDAQVSGGLRFTSGLSIGPTEGTTALPPARLGDGLRWGPLEPGTLPTDRPGAQVALPYIGLGYTTLSAREGWGLSADIGLGGQRPGERVRFGAGNPTTAQFEDVLNALRLAPVIQFGVSYAF
jgi:hypothetical protein